MNWWQVLAAIALWLAPVSPAAAPVVQAQPVDQHAPMTQPAPTKDASGCPTVFDPMSWPANCPLPAQYR